MIQIKEIHLADGNKIYVEMEEIDLHDSANYEFINTELPDGAELTDATSKVLDTMRMLKNTLGAVANTVYEGVKDTYPDEWELEFNIGFKGKINPVPVLLSGESDASIKVVAKWSKTTITQKPERNLYKP